MFNKLERSICFIVKTLKYTLTESIQQYICIDISLSKMNNKKKKNGEASKAKSQMELCTLSESS